MFATISTLLMSLAAVTANAAPDAAVAQFQSFKIGSYHAVALKDGGLQAPVDGKSFVVGQPNEAVGAVLKAGGAPADHFEFSIQPLLVHAGVHVLLFDTGAGGFFGDIAGKLPESMMAAGEKPASIDLVADLRLPKSGIDGVIDHEVFESIYNPGKLLLLVAWRDKAAAEHWNRGC